MEITPSEVRVIQNGKDHGIAAQQVFLLTGYRPSTAFFDQLGVRYDAETLRPEYNPHTFETNVPGVYLAGSIVAGRHNAEVFIENGRFHGQMVAQAIARTGGGQTDPQRQSPAATSG
jgi:thioredoxin reductase (NADPH)